MLAFHNSGGRKSQKKKKEFGNGNLCEIGGVIKNYVANGKVIHTKKQGEQIWRHKKELYVDRPFENRQSGAVTSQ